MGPVPGLGRSPGVEKNGNPLQIRPGHAITEAWQARVLRGHKESDMFYIDINTNNLGRKQRPRIIFLEERFSIQVEDYVTLLKKCFPCCPRGKSALTSTLESKGLLRVTERLLLS